MITHADMSWIFYVMLAAFGLYSQYRKAKKLEEDTKRKKESSTADKYVAPRPSAGNSGEEKMNPEKMLQELFGEKQPAPPQPKKVVKPVQKIVSKKQTEDQKPLAFNDPTNPYKISQTPTPMKEFESSSAISDATISNETRGEDLNDFSLRKAMIAQVILERPEF